MIEVLRLDHVQIKNDCGDLLQNFNFQVCEGEVHGIIGDYGISHTQLCRLCAGTFTPDKGHIFYYDQPIYGLTFSESLQKGIYIISSGLNLQPHMTALENIYLIARQRLGWRFYRKQILCLVQEYMDFFNISFSLQTEAGQLTVLQGCIVAMIGALLTGVRLFILDEITSAMNEQDSITFQRILSCLKYKGITIICMVHRIDELIRYTDRTTLVKNGCTVRCIDKNDYSYDKMLTMLLI